MDNTSKDNKYTSEAFISQLNKIYSLKENSIFSDEEYKNRKIQFIIDLINKGISQSLDNFLSDILTLKDKNILTIEEIKQIKNSLTSKEIKTEEKQNEDKSQSNKYYCGDCKSEIELSQEEIKKNLYICPNCSAINSLDGNSEANVVYEKETEINPKSNDYYCRFCNNKIELKEEDIVKAEFICSSCGKLNSIGNESTQVSTATLSLPIENHTKAKTSNRNNIIFALFLVVCIVLIYAISQNDKNNDPANDYKKRSEELRKENQKNNECENIKNKYKYLEKRKLNGKKSTEKFAEEIKALGFEFTDRNKEAWDNYSDIKYLKTENGCRVRLTVTVFENNDYFITVE